MDLLQAIGQSLLDTWVGGQKGRLVDDLPRVAQGTMELWRGALEDPEQRRAEVAALAASPREVVRRQVENLVDRIAAGETPEMRGNLKAYLEHVPDAIRRSMKGHTPAPGVAPPIAPDLALERFDEIMPFLPNAMPRFRSGERPLPGVDWELVELLGTGGFGEVWKAHNPHFDGVPPVALKFCLDREMKDTILRHEAAILNQVMRQGRHPGIVQLQHTYLSAEYPCLEYEYIDGGDLFAMARRWDRSRPESILRRATEVIVRLATILGSAHHLSPPIVHRDLKPSNILIRRREDGRHDLKVADFGIGALAASKAIAKETRGVTGPNQFLVTAIRGAHTPLYSSPQQKRGEGADPRDDVFSLGIIWHQLLTGDMTRGQPGGSRWTARLAVQGVPSAMIDLLGSCFEDDPNDRPVDAMDLAVRLKAIRITGAHRVQRQPAPPGDPPRSAEVPARSETSPARSGVNWSDPSSVAALSAGRGEVRRLEGHTAPILNIRSSRNGSRILSCGGDRTATLWEVGTGRPVRIYLGHDAWKSSGVAFSNDGRHVLFAVDDGLAVWDMQEGQIVSRFIGETGPLTALALSPDGQRAASAGLDGALRFWDVMTGTEFKRVDRPEGPTNCLAVSPDSRRLAAGNADGSIQVYSLRKGKERRRYAGHTAPVLSLAFSADSQRLASGDKAGRVRVWFLDSAREPRSLDGHSGEVRCVTFTPGGGVMAGGSDGLILHWNAERGGVPDSFVGHLGPVRCLGLTPDGRLAFSGGEDRTVRLWQVEP